MSKFLQRVLVCGAMILLPWMMQAQQLTNANFEDWSGASSTERSSRKGGTRRTWSSCHSSLTLPTVRRVTRVTTR